MPPYCKGGVHGFYIYRLNPYVVVGGVLSISNGQKVRGVLNPGLVDSEIITGHTKITKGNLERPITRHAWL